MSGKEGATETPHGPKTATVILACLSSSCSPSAALLAARIMRSTTRDPQGSLKARPTLCSSLVSPPSPCSPLTARPPPPPSNNPSTPIEWTLHG